MFWFEILGLLLKCIRCGYEVDGLDLLNICCPRCGGVLGVDYVEKVFRVDGGGRGVWRYSSMLPLVGSRVSLGEGLTPVKKVGDIWVKNERFNPTGSYADRASALVISYLKGVGVSAFTSFYEKDFGRSIAYYAQSVGVEVNIFVEDIDGVDQEDMVFLVSNNVELVFDEARIVKPMVRYGNPLTVEGLKTIVFELYESRVSADKIVVPSESGVLALSILKGLKDLEEVGIDLSYEVVAVTTRKSPVNHLEGVKEVKLVEVGDREVYEAVKNAYRKGFKTKPLSALSLYIAENMGKAIAILTAGYRTTSSRDSTVKKMIIEILKNEGKPMTAYEIWKTKPLYTLRAIYKVLKAMEIRREVCFDVISKGMKKVKMYKLC